MIDLIDISLVYGFFLSPACMCTVRDHVIRSRLNQDHP